MKYLLFNHRRPPEMWNKGPLYLITISKPKGPVWFSRQRMGEHKIGEIMKSMAKKSGLSASTGKKFTNHSSLKTCVQKLKSAGVPRDQIINVTGHRNVMSRTSYEGDDENQCRQLSFIISGNNPESKSNPSPLQPLVDLGPQVCLDPLPCPPRCHQIPGSPGKGWKYWQILMKINLDMNFSESTYFITWINLSTCLNFIWGTYFIFRFLQSPCIKLFHCDRI